MLAADSHKTLKGSDKEEDYYIKCDHSPFKIHFEKTVYNVSRRTIQRKDPE